jgi:hypothetical protein
MLPSRTPDLAHTRWKAYLMVAILPQEARARKTESNQWAVTITRKQDKGFFLFHLLDQRPTDGCSGLVSPTRYAIRHNL